jgi:hypothetical protein
VAVAPQLLKMKYKGLLRKLANRLMKLLKTLLTGACWRKTKQSARRFERFGLAAARHLL